MNDIVLDICVKRLAQRGKERDKFVARCDLEDIERGNVFRQEVQISLFYREWERTYHDSDDSDYEYFLHPDQQVKWQCNWCKKVQKKRERDIAIADYPWESCDELKELIEILRKLDLD